MSGLIETASLSIDELNRLQGQLLELRTKNYQLIDQKKKSESEVAILKQRIKMDNVPTNLASKFIVRTTDRKEKSINSYKQMEVEIADLRQKLAIQEEEFRLQQSTIMTELNKVITHADDLERQIEVMKSLSSSFNDNVSTCNIVEKMSEITLESDELKRRLQDANLRLKNAQFNESEGNEKIAELEKEIGWLKGVCADKEFLKDDDANELRIKLQNSNKKCEDLASQIDKADEKAQKQHNSYILLNEEKAQQYLDYRKSLDSVVRKKDVEINTFLSEIHQLRQKLAILDQLGEKEQLWEGERQKFEDGILSLRSDLSELRDQNESFQLQLQETHSANDCLSVQLEESRNETVLMQSKMDESMKNVEKHKKTIDKMNERLEKSRNENRQIRLKNEEEKQECIEKLEHEARTRMSDNEQRLRMDLEKVATEMLETREKLEQCENEKGLFEERSNEHLQRMATDARQKDDVTMHEQQHTLNNGYSRLFEQAARRLTALEDEKVESSRTTTRLTQELKDKGEEMKLVEKKQAYVIKDLRRQITTEKKRADKMAEKVQQQQELLIARRNGSPGSFEEIKAVDLVDVRRHVGYDSGSISSWGLVTGFINGTKSEKDEADSVSSVHLQLEADNADLISRMTVLQKERSELNEKVHFLEQANQAMSEDLLQKSSIIEIYIRDNKAPFHTNEVSSSNLSSANHGGLKKMLDLMKIDQGAGDIREMNRRLQKMLEEILIKNMSLQNVRIWSKINI